MTTAATEYHADLQVGVRNRRTYYSLCLALIEQGLKQDGWRLHGLDKQRIEPGRFGLSSSTAGEDRGDGAAIAVFCAATRRQRLFVFFSDQDPAVLETAATEIAGRDQDRFEDLAVMITPTTREMQSRREASRAAAWPRGFFMAFDQLCAQSAGRLPELRQPIQAILGHACRPQTAWPAGHTAAAYTPRHTIATFRARIIDHVVVGGKRSPYRKLRFEAPELCGIAPPQFIMMATRPGAPEGGVREVSWKAFQASFQNSPVTYLKRPFGIHRAFPKGFPADYLYRLRLPRHLAAIMHPAMPDTFDVFYKVLPTGKGTPEMQHLKPDTLIDMIGPLGQPFPLAGLLDRGVREVHVIGGGVGMAPLVYLVQSLRLAAIPVKAFIGIERLDHLRYRQRLADDRLVAMHAAGGKDIHIYVDDLLQTGVERRDIYVSYDRTGDVRDMVPAGNHRQGFVSDLYANVLEAQPPAGPAFAFACGPTPMMYAVHKLTRQAGIPLYVLMEKRMACGIGVCLSCVCRTRDGRGGYSRVCKEGPLFDANEIIWNEQDNAS